MTTVSGEQFRAWMAPKVAAVQALTDAIDAVSVRHELPAANSRAMSELVEERGHANPSKWEHPTEDALGFGGMTLRAASDYLRSVATLFDSDYPSLYGYMCLTRAALESAVVCAWLSEPGVGRVNRTKRALCELVYSANEVQALKLGPSNDAFWLTVAENLGWTINNGRSKPTIDGERRPRVSDGIVSLSGRETDSRVGDMLYSQLSAVDHVTWWGITSAFHLGDAERNDQAGTAAVPVGMDGAKVSTYLYYTVKVVMAAATARLTLMGWLDAEWQAAVENATTLERELLAAAAAGWSLYGS